MGDTEPTIKKPKLFDEDGDESYTPSVFNPKYRVCPYLDTINRQILDFDFEKLCSISLTRINVYACLVCGKYFQGRGTNTHAYTHSVSESHHVFLNLQTLRFYCLPDNYEIIDSSLDDIKYVLNPTFTSSEIKNIDSPLVKYSRTVDGTLYLPGVVGLNNIKANDYCNVVLHALSHVGPLRDYFLREENYAKIRRPPGDSIFTLVQRFGELMRKMWNPRNFKAHVSPHEMLQAVVLWSNKRFQITEQGDPIDYLSWFLHTLHRALKGTKKPDSSIIYKSFLGEMTIYTRKIPSTDLDDTQKALLLATEEYQEKSESSSFLYLTCDLPPPPLFTDEFRENIIPQVNLYQLLAKFNGITEKEYKTYKDNYMKRFEINRLPNFIILYIKRFTKNTFFLEKNPTIVNFPIKNVDFGDILTPENRRLHPSTKYNLVANIVHDGEPKKGTYRVHILHKSNGQWYEMQDLHVTNILPQMITLTEAYIQIYERSTD
ncbi:unnamed protein product [Hermetia illucens]|uniref:Ubiquitin carboxyl-terminal hydrolase 39 n=1 Tax=Hermetia illucens TaxID=343691 RepID=A0A7R8UUU6_HERIL|nr:U4/U6.U5 tri-snRNP-associated protein 2 [Hermetia illucens]CAD7087095.1 unnamed protein product [Hermetia illucens]